MALRPPSEAVNRRETTPFFLRLFYKTGSFHQLDEFSVDSYPSTHLQLYTWPDCTLRELSHHLLSALPSALPSPAVGTRLAFRIVFPDTHGGSRGDDPHRHYHHNHNTHQPAPFTSLSLGSVVIGSDLPDPDTISLDAFANDNPHDHGASASASAIGAADPHSNNDTITSAANHDQPPASAIPSTAAAARDPAAHAEADKTLHAGRFVVGDHLCCAILPPLPNGRVAPPLRPAVGAPAGRVYAPGGRGGVGMGGGGGRRGGFESGGLGGAAGVGAGPGEGHLGFGGAERRGGRTLPRRSAPIPDGWWARGDSPGLEDGPVVNEGSFGGFDGKRGFGGGRRRR